MARDHTRVNLDIWGDDDFRDLPVDAQNLYWTLWTSPDRTYCGAHEWRPGKLSQCAEDWTIPRLLAAAVILSERLFVLFDDITEECLIRSWIKHDGLWRTPNMAVTMANARAAMGSKMLRGVIVHEVKKLVKAEPELNGWKRDEVVKMLSQRDVDPADIEPYNPDPNGGINPGSNPPANPYGQNPVNPTDNPPPTTATASLTTATSTGVGYVSTEGHQGATPDPRPECHEHSTNHDGPCRACKRRRDWDERHEGEALRSELEQKRRLREIANNCPRCQGTNTYQVASNMVAKCDPHIIPGEAESA